MIAGIRRYFLFSLLQMSGFFSSKFGGRGSKSGEDTLIKLAELRLNSRSWSTIVAFFLVDAPPALPPPVPEVVEPLM